MKNRKRIFLAKLIAVLFVLPTSILALYCFWLQENQKTSLLLENVKIVIQNSFFKIAIIILYILVWLFTLNHLYKLSKEKRRTVQIKSKDIKDYYREIPCNGNLERSYWLLYNFTDVDEKTLKIGIIGAYILKWVKEKRVLILDDNKLKKSLKDANYRIDLGNGDFEKTESEEELYNILKEVAGSNNILEKREFIIWQKKNAPKLKQWYKNLIEFETIEQEYSKSIIYDGNILDINKMQASAQLLQEAEQLLELKKFLLDYSLISEREHIEVALWEYYLIFAELLGIADKVDEQFKKIVPNYSVMSKIVISLSKDNVSNTITMIYINKILVTILSGAILMFFLFIIFDIIIIVTLLEAVKMFI